MSDQVTADLSVACFEQVVAKGSIWASRCEVHFVLLSLKFGNNKVTICPLIMLSLTGLL